MNAGLVSVTVVTMSERVHCDTSAMRHWLSGILLTTSVASCALVLSPSVGQLSFEAATFALAGIAFGIVGTILARRRPDNAIGWLFGVIGLLMTVGSLGESLAVQAGDPTITRVEIAASWIATWYWIPYTYCLVVFLPLVFPTGQPRTRIGRRIAAAAIGAMTISTILGMFPQRLLANDDPAAPVFIDNPVGYLPIASAETDMTAGLLMLVAGAFALASVVSLVIRFRRSRDAERQQLKWGVLGLLALLLYFLIAGLVLWERFGDGRSPILDLVFLSGVPVTMGVAVLRYRLYDIDRIISRVLSYSALTAILIGCYLAVVLVPTSLLGGEPDTPDVVIAGATLVAAALFRPVRGRVQTVVDRRFNRARYDAGEVVRGFSTRLRDEVDLATIMTELRTAVAASVQPERVSIWVAASRSSGTLE